MNHTNRLETKREANGDLTLQLWVKFEGQAVEQPDVRNHIRLTPEQEKQLREWLKPCCAECSVTMQPFGDQCFKCPNCGSVSGCS